MGDENGRLPRLRFGLLGRLPLHSCYTEAAPLLFVQLLRGIFLFPSIILTGSCIKMEHGSFPCRVIGYTLS